MIPTGPREQGNGLGTNVCVSSYPCSGETSSPRDREEDEPILEELKEEE